MKDGPYNYYVCKCDQDKEMSHNEMITHLKGVHKMEEPINASKDLIMHINREPRHRSTYKINIVDGPTVYQYIG